MENQTIKKAIHIHAPVSKVWSVFTDQNITKQMGGYYDTDWTAGSSFGFKLTNGDKLSDGILLEFIPEQLIKHSLFEPESETVIAIIGYEFQQKEGYTILTGKEELKQPIDKSEFDDVSSGWETALERIKEIAERE